MSGAVKKCAVLSSGLDENPDGNYHVGQTEHWQPLLSVAESRMRCLTLGETFPSHSRTNDTTDEAQKFAFAQLALRKERQFSLAV